MNMSLHDKKNDSKRIEELKKLIEEGEEDDTPSSTSQKFVSTKDKDKEDDSVWAKA